MSDETVMVQPVRTFLEGRDLVHPASEPYRVSRARALELRGLGLVEHVEAAPASTSPADPEPPAAAEPDPVALTPPAPPAEPAAPRRRGRPPKTR